MIVSLDDNKLWANIFFAANQLIHEPNMAQRIASLAVKRCISDSKGCTDWIRSGETMDDYMRRHKMLKE
jgi:hypothetical protein